MSVVPPSLERVFHGDSGRGSIERLFEGRVKVTTTELRAARARAALARAEQRTGITATVLAGSSSQVPDVRPAPDPRPEPARAVGLLTDERPALPVPAALASLLPAGLRRGSTTVVAGSTWLMLLLVARACSGGAWAGAVGQPSLGLLAAAQAGIDLDRFAMVPQPGRDGAAVVAALLDGMDVVVVGPQVALAPSDRARLAARARDRGAALLSTTPWPGAGVVLTVEHRRWSGIASGEGRLARQELRVSRVGRGSAAVPARADLVLRPGEGLGGPCTVEMAPARTGPGGVRDDVARDGWRLVG